MWWSGPKCCFLSTFQQQFQPRETHEEMKHCNRIMPTYATQLQEPHSHIGDVINLSDQNSPLKALGMFVQIERLKNKCRNKKIKPFMFVLPTELHQALELLLRQDQHKAYNAENKNLKTSPQTKEQGRLSRLYPFLHSGILCSVGRLAQVDLFDETKYPRLILEGSE